MSCAARSSRSQTAAGIFEFTSETLQCSLFQNFNGNKPCIVYSHSHSGNRSEASAILNPVLEEFSVCSFDFSGFGHSEGKHSTLGLKEQDDLEAVVEHLRSHFKFQTIYVWGRSMGAVTSLLLANKSQNSFCDAMILDAPFASTQKMVGIAQVAVQRCPKHT